MNNRHHEKMSAESTHSELFKAELKRLGVYMYLGPFTSDIATHVKTSIFSGIILTDKDLTLIIDNVTFALSYVNALPYIGNDVLCTRRAFLNNLKDHYIHQRILLAKCDNLNPEPTPSTGSLKAAAEPFIPELRPPIEMEKIFNEIESESACPEIKMPKDIRDQVDVDLAEISDILKRKLDTCTCPHLLQLIVEALVNVNAARIGFAP